MKNKNVEKAKTMGDKDIPESAIKSYLEEREEFVAMLKAGQFEDTSIPLTIRLNELDYAFIIMLAGKYDLTKSAMASEILSNALVDVKKHIGNDEYEKMINEGLDQVKSLKKELQKKRAIKNVKS